MCSVRKASRWLTGWAVAVAVALPFSVMGACFENSPHDLTNRFGPNTVVQGEELNLCAFCHTPSHPTVDAPVPVWQRVEDGQTSFQAQDPMQAILNPLSPSGGPGSFMCLACHDGTQAMDITQPKFAHSGSANHPVGVPYGGAADAETEISLERRVLQDFAKPAQGIVNNRQAWWIDTDRVKVAGEVRHGLPQQREKADLILYTREQQYGTASQDVPYVECASCHDPHQCNTETFLRIDNSNSALCLSCHRL